MSVAVTPISGGNPHASFKDSWSKTDFTGGILNTEHSFVTGLSAFEARAVNESTVATLLIDFANLRFLVMKSSGPVTLSTGSQTPSTNDLPAVEAQD